MSLIKVTPALLRYKSNRFAEQKAAIAESVWNLDRHVNDLDDEWQGRAKQAFYDSWEETHAHLAALVDLLDAFADELLGIATVFRDADLNALGTGGPPPASRAEAHQAE